MRSCPRIGQIGEPFVKQTKTGWVVMSPGRESDMVSALFTRTPANEFEQLCDTDVPGLKKNHYRHDDYVNEFKLCHKHSKSF